MGKRKAAPAPLILLRPGELVLLGAPQYSYPSEWWVATVLWSDDRDMLVEHNAPSDGALVRNLFPRDYLRAVGDRDTLRRFKDKALQVSRGLEEQIDAAKDLYRQAEHAQKAAREAQWAALETSFLTKPQAEVVDA